MRDKTKGIAIAISIIAASGIIGLISWGVYELVQYMSKDRPTAPSKPNNPPPKNINKDFKTYLLTMTISY